MAATFEDLGFVESKPPSIAPQPATDAGLADLGFTLKPREVRMPRIEPPADLSRVQSADAPIVLNREMTKAVTPKMPKPEKPEIDEIQQSINALTLKNRQALAAVPSVRALPSEIKNSFSRDEALHALASDYLNLADADEGFYEGLVKAGSGEGGVAKFAPFIGGLASAQAKQLRNSLLEKMARKEPLSDMEQQAVKAMALANRRLAQKPGLFEQAAEITAMSIPYAAEFALTGGIYGGARKLAGKAVEGASGAVKYIAPRLAGVAAQTAVASPARVAAAYYDRMAPAWQTDPVSLKAVVEDKQADKDWRVELSKAGLDSAIENLSERTGGYLGKIIPTEGIVKLFRLGALRNWMARNTSASVTEAAKKLKTAVAFNGVVPEVFEEYVGEGLRSITGVNNADVLGRLQVGDVPGALAEFWKAMPVEETPAMLISFGMLPAGERAAGLAIGGAQRVGRTLREIPQKQAINEQVGTPEARQEARASAAFDRDQAVNAELAKLGFTQTGGPNANREQSAVVKATSSQAVGVPAATEGTPGQVQRPAAAGEAQGAKPAEALTTALQAAEQWDRQVRHDRSDAWFEGGKVDADARAGFNEALLNGGDQVQAHGMSKELTLGSAIKNLVNLLTNGLDQTRRGGRLDTAPIVAKPGEGLVGATASGSAYTDGPFMIVQRPGTSGLTGKLENAAAILVNQANAHLLPQIRAAIHAVRPDIVVDTYANSGKVVFQLNAKPAEEVHAEAQAVAKEIGATFRPVAAVKMEGIPPEYAVELEKLRKENGWEFTPQDGPAKGQTFYVPEGATRETILKRYQEKLDASQAKGGENNGQRKEKGQEVQGSGQGLKPTETAGGKPPVAPATTKPTGSSLRRRKPRAGELPIETEKARPSQVARLRSSIAALEARSDRIQERQDNLDGSKAGSDLEFENLVKVQESLGRRKAALEAELKAAETKAVAKPAKPEEAKPVAKVGDTYEDIAKRIGISMAIGIAADVKPGDVKGRAKARLKNGQEVVFDIASRKVIEVVGETKAPESGTKPGKTETVTPKTETKPPVAETINRGDWIEYEDSYGKTHQGKVSSVMKVGRITPYGAETPRIEYMVEDAAGKAMVSPKEGSPVKKISPPESDKTAIIIARDRVLEIQSVKNALANSTETNAKAEISAQLKNVLGAMASEMINKPGVDSIGRTWAESYNVATDPKDRESFIRSIYSYAKRNQKPSENPKAPEPTKEPEKKTGLPGKMTQEDVSFFIKKLESGSMIFWAGNDMAAAHLPIFQDIPKLEHLGYGVFRGKGQGYEITVDGGGAMARTGSGVSYTIASVTGEYPYSFDSVLIQLRKMQREAAPAKDTTVDDSIIYVSGMEKNLEDIKRLMATKKPIGVTCPVSETRSLSPNVRRLMVQYADEGGQVFIDSGAFVVFKENLKNGTKLEVNWPLVLATYKEIVSATKNPSNITITAPDLLGDAFATRELWGEYADEIEALIQLKANIIFAVHKEEGTTLDEAVDDVPVPLRPSFTGSVIFGIPFNEVAWSKDDLTAFFKARAGEKNMRIHLLGGGESDVNWARQEAKQYDIEFAHLSGDASYDETIRERKHGPKAEKPLTPKVNEKQAATDENLKDLSDDEFDALLDEASKPVKKSDEKQVQVKPPPVNQGEQKPAKVNQPTGSSLRKPKVEESHRLFKQGDRVILDDGSPGTVLVDQGQWRETLIVRPDNDTVKKSVPFNSVKRIETKPAPSAKNAAKAMKEALDEAAKGLDELFGGGTTLGTGPSFDEERYKKAKPHFDAAWAKSKEAGAEIVDFLRSIIVRWGEGVKPYLKRWRQDLLKESEATNAGNGPMGENSGDVDEGQRPGSTEGTGETTGTTSGESGSGNAGGAAGASSGGKGSGKRGGRTGAGGTVSGDDTAGGSDTDQRPGVDEDAGNAEVRRGRDVEATDNLRIQPDERLAPENRTARINANLKAWALSKQLQSEDRPPTPDEKRVLMQFSGWGDTFQVFGLTKIGNREAGTIYEAEKNGRDIQYILYDDKERASFDRWKKQYAATYDQLKDTLTEDEWDSAKVSSLNAHFTSRVGIEGLWSIIKRAGWQGGTAIESSAGIGSIIGLTPDDFAGKVHWVGIELDKMTAQMLKQLYPASDIQNVGYERSLRTENNSADLVVSNFPFGDYDIADINHPDYDGWSIHNYFLARSIDALKPGGIVVAITSRYTMDGSKSANLRKWLAQRADLIGAIRLPDTAFKASAGTEVVTDILVFQKKNGIGGSLGQRFATLAPIDIPKELRSKQKESESDEDYEKRMAKVLYINQYFAEHPEMVLGTHTTQGTMYAGDSYTVTPKEGELSEQLAQAIANLPENFIKASENEIEQSDNAETFGIVSGRKPDAYLIEDGQIYQVDNQGRLLKPDHIKSVVAKSAVRKLIHLRDAVLAQIDLELREDSNDSDIETSRQKLNDLYDKFREAHGALNERKNNYIDDDPEWPLLASMEDEKTNAVEVTLADKKVKRFVSSYVKGPMLQKRVNFPRSEPAKADNLADAVSISLNYRGAISLDYVAQLTGMSPGEAQYRIISENLAFENPESGLLETPDLYLSGFVKKKLDAARRVVATLPKYQRNVEALEKVIPADLPAEQIFFRLGSNWISPKQIERFLSSVMEVNATVTFTRAGDETQWSVSEPTQNSVANSETWAAGRNDDQGVEGLHGHEMVEDSLNLKSSEVKIQVEDEHGNKKTIVLPDQTAAARDMQEQIQEKFRNWVRTTTDEAIELEQTYNRLFNGMVRREYPVPNFERFPGASTLVDLRDWQKRGAMRAVQEGTMLAHTVGTGKTFTLITAAMEMRRLRTARKPMIVVQNSTLTQFANSFRRLYPTARLLVGNSKQTEGDKRTAFIARAATGDWDAVVIPQSFFERIPNDPEREQSYVQEQLDALDQMIAEAEGPKFDGKRAKTALGKQLLKTRKRFENRMNRILDRLAKKSDDLITFERLGVDALLVDEAHNFKRGDFQTKMDRVKGLDTNGSDKSMDFLLKTMFIHDHSPDRNVVLATGTPISNTLAEMWTMLRYVRPNLLKDFGVSTFDDFVATFATTKASLEETPTGGFSQVTRLARYVNGPEIGQFWRAAADVYVLNRDDFKGMGVNVPEIEGGIPTEVILERSEPLTQFIDFMRDWRAWWEDLDGKDKAEMTWVPIVQYTLARKAAIDLRLINPKWLDDPESKVNRVVKEVFKLWTDSRADSGTQLIFSNLYQSHDPDTRWLNEELHLPNPLFGEPVFNVFEDMKKKLVALGVPESDIADFTQMNEATRFATAEQLKAGTIRIAFGTTESLGTGLNVQDHIVALHHVDPQFRPMDFEQRNGRAIRQGNMNPFVKILVYGVKKTMDSTLYALMLVKQKFIAQMMTADNMGREFDDPSDDSVMSFQAMSAAFSGNPLFAQRFALENDVRKLSILASDFDRKKSSARNSLRETQEGGAKFEDTVEILKRSKEFLSKAFGTDDFEIVFKDERAKGEDGKKLLNRIIVEAFEQMRSNFKEEFDSGDLHKANEKKIKERIKWVGETGTLQLDARRRTRRISINGIQFEVELWQRAEIPLTPGKGEIKLSGETAAAGGLTDFMSGGRWELLGHNTTSWSDTNPWYNSVIKIHGTAHSGDELTTSYTHAIAEMGSMLARVEPARKRIAKTIEDLQKQIKLPFEMTNRLKEQEEKLREVLKELETSGALQAAATPPSMEDIIAKSPQFAYITKQVAAENHADIITKINAAERAEALKSFYIFSDGQWTRIKKGAKAVEIPGWKWIEAFSRSPKDGQVDISEATTGMRFGTGKTLELAKADAIAKLTQHGEDKIRKLLKDFWAKNGPSPRAKAKDANPTIFTKFQLGGLVVIQREDERLIGQVRELLVDSGELGLDIDGKLQVWPVRVAEPATAEDQQKWDAEQKLKIAPPPTDEGSDVHGMFRSNPVEADLVANAGLTTIPRQQAAEPTQWLMGRAARGDRRGWNSGFGKGQSVLHFGSGKDKHSTELLGSLGATVKEYDPNYAPDRSVLSEPHDTVVSNFVLNVLPPEARETALQDLEIAVGKNGIGYISVRAAGDKSINGEPAFDGVQTSRGTFQKGYTVAELTAELKRHFHVVSIEKGTDKTTSITVQVQRPVSLWTGPFDPTLPTPKAGMLAAQSASDVTGTTSAEGIDEIRKLINDPNNGLNDDVRLVANAWLDTPVMRRLNWGNIRLSLISKNGVFGGSADLREGLIEIVRQGRDMAVVPHEFFHFIWQLLPREYQAAIERERQAAIQQFLDTAVSPEERRFLNEIAGNNRSILDRLINRNPGVSSQAFKDEWENIGEKYGKNAQNLFEQYYRLINPGEYFSMLAGDKFSLTTEMRATRNRLGQIYDTIKEIILQALDAMRRVLNLPPTFDQAYREAVSGRFTSVTTGNVRREKAGMFSPELPTPAEREATIKEGAREGWVPTRVMGNDDFVRGRSQITPESTNESLIHARNIFNEAGLRVVQDMSVGGWRLDNPGFDQSAEGRKLVEILKREIQSKNAPGRAGDLLASLLNSVVLNFKAGVMNFDQPTRLALYQLAQSDRSQRGLALGALAGFREDTSFVGQNVDVVLHRVYSDAFGGEQLGMLLERVIKEFRSFFTDAEIADALKNSDNAETMIERIIALNRKDDGGRVYRRVQSMLKPKKAKELATLEADARIEEAVQEILQQAEAQGIIPKESPNRPLPALRRLLLMVSEKNAQKIDLLVANAVAQGERNAGIKATLKNATEEERADLMGRFAEGEEPDAEMIEEGLSYPEYSHWRDIRDNLLNYSPVTIKLVKDVIRGGFKGTVSGKARPAVVDARLDLDKLAVQPEAEVQRSLDDYYANIEANVTLAGASGETLQRVSAMVKDEVSTQLEAARKRYRDPMFRAPVAPGEKPTADQLLGRQINAGLFKDERLDVPEMVERVATKSRLQRLTPKLADLIKTVFDTPFYRQDDLRRTFAEEMIKRFGVSDEQAEQAAKVFERAFAKKFTEARTRALKQAREAITPKAPMLIAMKKSVWRRIEQAVNSGVFDDGSILREIALANGWTVPSDQLIADMKEWSGAEQALRELSPAEQAKYAGDPAKLEAARREKEAVTMERRIQLKKRIEVEWSKLTRPISFDSFDHWWANRRNFAAAANELASANLLLKLGFAPRQALSVLTQGAIHTPTRAIASAIGQHRRDLALGRESNLWEGVNIALRDSYRARFAAVQAALYATRAAFLGRGEARNVDRLMSSIAAVERIARAADAAEAAGNHGRAGTLRLVSLIRLGYRVAQAMDNIHGLPAEYQDMILQVERGLRELGKTRAEIEVSKDKVIGNMHADWLLAIDQARLIMDSAGMTPTKAELEESAWNLVKRWQYDRIRELGLPADDFEEQNRMLRSTIGWNERETKGLGGLVGRTVSGLGQLGESAGVPLALGRFGNAIAISINRNLAFTPFYFLADVGPGESGWFKTDTDRTQRKVEAALGSTVGVAIMALVWSGALVVRLSWPKDKEERDLWEAQGIRAGTVEIHLGDGKFIPFSLNTGPFAPLAPYLAAGGALNELTKSREKAQAKLDAEAAKRGVPAGKVKPVDLSDMLGVAAAAAYGSVMGGRTAAGLISSVTDYGLPNASKFTASQVSPYVPTLPAMQEIMRMAGVNLDARMASFWDFLLPLPSSSARKVNLLGEPAGTPDDVQRIVQTLLGGNYPGVVDPNAPAARQAYEALFASGYRPPSINPGKGYQFGDSYRPMTTEELRDYTVNRGRYFAEELGSAGDSPVEAKAAYARANQRALESVGASRPTSRQAPRVEAVARPAMPSLPRLSTVARSSPRGFSLRRPSLRLRRPRGMSRRTSFARPRSGRTLRLRRPSLRRRNRR